MKPGHSSPGFMMKVLGIDPGTTRIGWGVVEEQKGTVIARAYGCITPQASELPDRLRQLYRALQKLLTTYHPDTVSVEELFFSTNVKTALSVGYARGVVILAAAQAGLPVVSYTPSAIKLTITGTGAADKSQVQKMVTRLLRLKETPKPDDTADALAAALTHAFSYKVKSKMQKAKV